MEAAWVVGGMAAVRGVAGKVKVAVEREVVPMVVGLTAATKAEATVETRVAADVLAVKRVAMGEVMAVEATVV